MKLSFLITLALFSIPALSQTGTALHFDGIDDYVDVKISNIPERNHSWTIEFWIKSGMSAGKVGTIVSSVTQEETKRANVAIRDGKIAITNGLNEIRASENAPAVNDNKWHHVAITYGGGISTSETSGFQIYMDTLEVGVELENAQPEAFRVLAKELLIGTMMTANLEGFFKGSIDNLRIWSTVRTLDQVKSNFNLPLMGDEQGLMINYDFDNGVANGNNSDMKTLHNLAIYPTVSSDKTHFELTGDTPTLLDQPSNTVSPDLGNALRFDGITNYLEADYPMLPEKNDSWTVELWVKTSTANDQIANLVSWGFSHLRTSNHRMGVAVRDGKLAFIGQYNDTFSDDTAPFINDNQWHHLAVSYGGALLTDVTNGLKFYVDGNEINTKRKDHSQGSQLNLRGYRFRLGHISVPRTDEWFKGDMDEVRVWNNVRTAQEISSNYQNELSGAEPGLLLYYNFNDQNLIETFHTAPVVASYQRDGFLRGFDLIGDQSNFVKSKMEVEFEYGRALHFDGMDDYVDGSGLTAVSLPQGNQPWTVECWTKTVMSDEDISYFVSWGNRSKTNEVSIGCYEGELFFSSNYNDMIARDPKKINDGKWHHVAVSYGGGITTKDNGIKMYIDGEAVLSHRRFGSAAKLNVTDQGLTFGKGPRRNGVHNVGINDQQYSGKLDEVRIWNDIRMPEEIKSNFDRELTGKEAGLLVYCNFEEGVKNLADNPYHKGIRAYGDNSDKINVIGKPVGTNLVLKNFKLKGTTSNYVPGVKLYKGPQINTAEDFYDFYEIDPEDRDTRKKEFTADAKTAISAALDIHKKVQSKDFSGAKAALAALWGNMPIGDNRWNTVVQDSDNSRLKAFFGAPPFYQGLRMMQDYFTIKDDPNYTQSKTKEITLTVILIEEGKAKVPSSLEELDGGIGTAFKKTLAPPLYENNYEIVKKSFSFFQEYIYVLTEGYLTLNIDVIELAKEDYQMPLKISNNGVNVFGDNEYNVKIISESNTWHLPEKKIPSDSWSKTDLWLMIYPSFQLKEFPQFDTSDIYHFHTGTTGGVNKDSRSRPIMIVDDRFLFRKNDTLHGKVFTDFERDYAMSAFYQHELFHRIMAEFTSLNGYDDPGHAYHMQSNWDSNAQSDKLTKRASNIEADFYHELLFNIIHPNDTTLAYFLQGSDPDNEDFNNLSLDALLGSYTAILTSYNIKFDLKKIVGPSGTSTYVIEYTEYNGLKTLESSEISIDIHARKLTFLTPKTRLSGEVLIDRHIDIFRSQYVKKRDIKTGNLNHWYLYLKTFDTYFQKD
jgi:hypothetical protein